MRFDPASQFDEPVIHFAGFELDTRVYELRKNGVPIHLQPQPCRVLALLASQPGRVFTREEIQHKIWGEHTYVDFEQGLNVCIRQIRAALNDDPEKPRFVETLSRRGYRFIAKVETRSETAVAGYVIPASPVQPATRWTRSRRWLLPVVVALAAVAAVGLLIVRMWGPSRKTPADEIRSLAVLPLDNLSGDPNQDYFADGITEALITELARFRGLRVVSRTSVMQFKKAGKPLPEIAQQLGVDGIVEGAVVRDKDRVRVTVQLIAGRSDEHLWGATYDRELRDMLDLQRDVAQAIAREIKLTLSPQEQARLTATRPVNPEAHELYLRGRYHWNTRTEQGLLKSVEYFQQAIQKDPSYAQAYAGLADAYGILGNNRFLAPEETFPKARTAALKALELDEGLAEAHTSLAIILGNSDWDWPEEERRLRRAIELNPGYGTAHHILALLLTRLRRHEEAIAEIRTARLLDPYSPRINVNVGMVLYRAHRYEEAIQELRKALELFPNDHAAHAELGAAYMGAGRPAEALAECERARQIAKDYPLSAAPCVSQVYVVTGRIAKARRVPAELSVLSKQRYVSPYILALAHAGLEDKQQTLTWLEKAYRERAVDVTWSGAEPLLVPLRSDPRFQDLLRRIGLPY